MLTSALLSSRRYHNLYSMDKFLLERKTYNSTLFDKKGTLTVAENGTITLELQDQIIVLGTTRDTLRFLQNACGDSIQVNYYGV